LSAKILAVLPLILAQAGTTASAGPTSTPAKLEIHVGKPIAKVSQRLYGLMTEEINHAYDGGLYAGRIDRHAKLTTLTAKTTQATNTLATPTNVAPTTTTLTGLGRAFKHTMPAYSIQVLEIFAK
jgi:alpha-N-arabinofuranosidase